MPLLHVQAGSTDQLQGIADALWKARKVVVITGAGISTNSGIPDFRSENGLYSMIQSQFDAAAKLGVTKADLSSAASDERPRKRRRMSPPVEDSIEVAPESCESVAPPIGHDPTKVAKVEDTNPTIIEDSIIAAMPRRNSKSSINVAPGIDDSNEEATSQMEDEVVLLSEESVLGGEHLLYEQDRAKNVNNGAREELLGSSHKPRDCSKNHTDKPPKTVQPISPAAFTIQASMPTSQALQSLPSSLKPPERFEPLEGDDPLQGSQVGQNTSQPLGLSTPKPTSKSGPQTTSSSPLSSPPPAELFDSFDEQSTEPPSSSTRPSSPVSTDSEGDGKDDDGDETEPSFSQDYLHRSSTFRRSLSTLKGKELFDASIWSDPLKTSVFYTFATNLRQKSRDAAPTGCHQFIGHLSKAGKMVRCYTQNIDLLEDKVGLSTRLLLGAGSRSRFSTRAIRGVAASTNSTGPRQPGDSNSQATSVQSVPCSEAPAPSQSAVDGQANSQEASPANSQAASSQPVEEVDIIDQRRTGSNQELAEGSSDQSGERDEKPEEDGVKACTQPSAASSTVPDKPLTGPDGGASPEHDRGVECVFLHGSLRALRCFQCGCVTDWDDGRELQTMSGQQPPCPRCEDATNARQERGKRALGVGKLRPDIVLYGEDHPESQQISSIIQHDISLAPDMLIIMGTSLKVHGLKTVVREFAKTVHNRKDGKVVFVNYTKPAESVWADTIDFWVEMDCDSWVEDLKEKKPVIWLPPGTVEAEPRNTIPKKRRAPKDEVVKGAKKPKKVEKTTKMAAATAADDKGKAGDTLKLERLTYTDAKPYVPKRPAAHRDCKQNAAYWTTKIMAHLANMTGRMVAPGPPPFRITPATQVHVPAKVRRGPRTKNTRSKFLEAAATSDTSMKLNSTVKEGKSHAKSSVAKAASRARTKSGGAMDPTIIGAKSAQHSMCLKGDPDGKADTTVLAEVPVPNNGPHPVGEDVPMVAAVKNRIRKPKVFYGESDPSPLAPARRGIPAAGNARPRTKAALQAKKAAKAVTYEQTHGLEGIQSQTTDIQGHGTQSRILPAPNPRRQPPTALTRPRSEPDESITLAPLQPSDRKPTNARKTSFLQMALGQPEATDHASPPPAFLEPAISPGPLDQSPQMSPNHWRKRAFSYGNALSRHFETSCRNLDFTSLRGGGTGVPAYVDYPHPMHSPGQYLMEAPSLLVGASSVPNQSPPVETLSAPDSPNRQLQKESEAAAALTQMAAYDHR